MKLGELGVGIITSQNATKDAPQGSEYSNVKKLGLGSGKPKIHNKKATKNSDPNTLFNLGITESVDASSLKPFVKFCIQSLELKSVPKIVITEKKLDGTFGYYNTETKTLTVSTNDRHEADVMRTLAHELVHLAQDEQNQDIDGSDGSKHENQANAVAGVIMRKWADKDPSLFENEETAISVQIDERGSIGVPLSSGLVASVFPHRPLKIKKSTPGKLRYDETITTVDLAQLETFADKLFAKVGIDVEFTRHFLDRVNDERNRKPITMAELTRLFKQEFKRWAKPIAQMGPGQEAVMKDLQTDINLPFALQYDRANNELDLIAKTVMRKKDFKTPNREFPVEGWSAKYKKSINCSNPKGFSQKAHCAGKKKTEEAPPGREKQVRKLKKKFDDPGAPYAIAWAQHNKHGKPTKEDDSKDTLGSRINFPGFEKKEKKPKYKPVPKQDKSILDKVKSWFTDDINEAYKLRLENDDDLLVLHIRNTRTGERAEVRGNPNYEIDYDENDELHQLLDVIGKASNISELMNGKIVSVNPKHPDGPKSYAALEKAMDEDVDLDEGVNDPHIFKAVFLAGGPGSGKSFVAKNILGGTGLRSINSDEVYEYLMKKQGLSLDPETIFSPQGQDIRDKAKGLSRKREATYLDGRLGLIIDGTGKDVSKYQVMAQKLKAIGYDISMIYVNTSLQVAQQRNKERERSLTPAEVEKMWNNVQQNLMQFQQIFGAGRFHIIDNSGGLEDLDRQKNFDKVYVETQRFLNTPPKNRKALAWIQKQKEQNDGQRSAKQPTNQEPDGGTTEPN